MYPRESGEKNLGSLHDFNFPKSKDGLIESVYQELLTAEW